MSCRLVVFDFDGTLVDSREPIARSANDALERLGLPPRPPAEVHALIGLPLAEVMGRLAGPARTADRVDALCTHYRERFDVHSVGRMPLFDEVRGMLAAARERGCALAVATSRSRTNTEAVLATHGLLEMFEFRIGGGCVKRGKPHPEMLHRVFDHFSTVPEDALMVGDTSYDIEMGCAAGAATCGVTYGSHDESTLRAAGAHHIVHHPRQLIDLFS